MVIGLFVGRFQPFHKGHLSAVKEALGFVDELIIGVGSSQYSDTEENPYSFDFREKMISNVLEEEGLRDRCFIVAIPDIHDPPHWVSHVVSCVKSLGKGTFKKVFVCNEETAELFREGGFDIEFVQMLKGVSGTRIRDFIRKGKNFSPMVPRVVFEMLNGESD